MTKTIKLLLLTVFCTAAAYAQTTFKSPTHAYTLTIPEGWSKKDKIYNADVDAKIVDGKGNSFIVTVKKFNTPFTTTAKEELSGLSKQEIESQFGAIYGDCELVKRGTMFIDGKEFYYLHITAPFQDGLKLYHKMFFYYKGNTLYNFDASSISNMTVETAPYFSIILTSFKFGK